jgi:plastocyanin
MQGRRSRPMTGHPAHRRAFLLALASVTVIAPAPDAQAQSVLDRPPNLGGTWTGPPGTLHFNFLHRFSAGAAPTRKVVSAPTFLLGASLPANLLAGVRYATASQVVPAFPNEWELFVRANPVRAAAGAPLDLSVHAGWNQAAESFDAELTVGRRLGPVRLLAAGRAFSAAYAGDSARFAIAGGATVRLNNTFALAADVATLLDAADTEDAAWGAALQIAIPTTPHTLSLQATNTNTGTLQGSSIGTGRTRWGFEFTIPLTLRRFFGARPGAVAAPRAADAGGPPVAAGRDTVRIAMKDLAYSTAEIIVAPGTTVIWTNDDPVDHTVTADAGAFDSGVIAPRQSWTRTFAEPGRFPYHCTPHPFMTGMVLVIER